MRSRYVKKCDCKSIPIIVRKVDTLQKGVLDIEIEVSCVECKRLYKEVGAKRTRMNDPDILGEIVKPLLASSSEELVENSSYSGPFPTGKKGSETGEEHGLEGSGGDTIETRESEEVPQQKEEPIGFETENPTPEIKSEEEKRDSDEAGSPDPVEKAPKKGRGRPPGKKNGSESVELAERPVGDSLEDCGVPLSDILA